MDSIKAKKEDAEALQASPAEAGSSERALQLQGLGLEAQQAALGPDASGYAVQRDALSPVQRSGGDPVQLAGGDSLYEGVNDDLEAAQGLVLNKIAFNWLKSAKAKLKSAKSQLDEAASSGTRLSKTQGKKLSFLNGKIVGYANETDITALCGQIGEKIVRVTA